MGIDGKMAIAALMWLLPGAKRIGKRVALSLAKTFAVFFFFSVANSIVELSFEKRWTPRQTVRPPVPTQIVALARVQGRSVR